MNKEQVQNRIKELKVQIFEMYSTQMSPQEEMNRIHAISEELSPLLDLQKSFTNNSTTGAM